MSYWVYSDESIPNQPLTGVPGYTPEYMLYQGVQVIVPEKSWFKLADNFYSIRHGDWRDRAGTRVHVAADDIVRTFKAQFGGRGVTIIDHEPSDVEKLELENKSRETNHSFRMRQVEWYEEQVREKEVTGHGRTKPTPYEDQCYAVLGLTKPYSVEAMRAQRHPGEAVGEQIVAALDRLEKRRSAQVPTPTAVLTIDTGRIEPAPVAKK